MINLDKNLKNRNKYPLKYYLSETSFYYRFRGLKARCEDVNNKDYSNYGGRGIKCEWKSFEEFMQDMFSSFKEELTLERIDVNGNYSKKNCRWATRKEQQRNRRVNHVIFYRGKKKCLSEWAEFFGINRYIIENRLNRGWGVELALTTKIRKYCD